MNENQNIPKLRFEGFTEPWEQRKLSELCSFDKGRGYSKSDLREDGTPIFLYGRMYTQYQTCVTSVDTFVEPQDNSLYSRGNEVVVPASGETAEEIAVASSIRSPGIILGGDLNVLTACEVLNPDFLALGISHGQPHYDLARLAQGKTIVHVHNDDIAQLCFAYPSLAEQEQIARSILQLDSLINLHQRRYERLRRLKQALLRKMFPKPGEQVPELRFEGFTEPWKERKLGELYVRAGSGGTPSSGDPRYYGGHIPFLGIADMDGRFITKTEKSLTDDGLSNSAAWIVPAGSISLAMYASVGKVGITCCDMATSQAFYNMVFDSTVTRDFVYSRLDRADCLSEWRSLISTGTQSNLNAQKVRDWAVAMPSLPEQHAIGSLFRELDDFITLQQRKYERLQHLKQALLRKMFI